MAALAFLIVINCWAITDNTSMSILLNSSKQHQAPDWARPEKKRPIIWNKKKSLYNIQSTFLPYHLAHKNEWTATMLKAQIKAPINQSRQKQTTIIVSFFLLFLLKTTLIISIHMKYQALFGFYTLCMLGNFSCFCCRLLIFSKWFFFSKNSFQNTTRVLNSFGSRSGQVGPDLVWVQTVCKVYQQMKKVVASKKQVKSINIITTKKISLCSIVYFFLLYLMLFVQFNKILTNTKKSRQSIWLKETSLHKPTTSWS